VASSHLEYSRILKYQSSVVIRPNDQGGMYSTVVIHNYWYYNLQSSKQECRRLRVLREAIFGSPWVLHKRYYVHHFVCLLRRQQNLLRFSCSSAGFSFSWSYKFFDGAIVMGIVEAPAPSVLPAAVKQFTPFLYITNGSLDSQKVGLL
jgi:hypothetical protein